MLPDSVCEQAAADTGGTYDAARELCESTNEGTTAACYGDSGGPAVAKEGEEYVLVGDLGCVIRTVPSRAPSV